MTFEETRTIIERGEIPDTEVILDEPEDNFLRHREPRASLVELTISWDRPRTLRRLLALGWRPRSSPWKYLPPRPSEGLIEIFKEQKWRTERLRSAHGDALREANRIAQEIQEKVWRDRLEGD